LSGESGRGNLEDVATGSLRKAIEAVLGMKSNASYRSVRGGLSQFVELRIGIVGHCDIDLGKDERERAERMGVLEKGVSEILRRRVGKRRYRLFSAFADGADRFAAHVAHEYDPERCRITAVLPFTNRSKGRGEGEKTQFPWLFFTQDVDEWLTVFGIEGDDDSKWGVRRSGPPDANPYEVESDEELNETLHYAASARYIVQNCDILICLWDGIFLGKDGGTSDTVDLAMREALRGRSPWVWWRRRRLAVEQVVTPRVGNRYPVGLRGQVHELTERLPPLRRVCNPRLRRAFYRYVIPIGAAIGAVLTGFWGYGHYIDEELESIGGAWGAILRAFSHLTLGAFEENHNWMLHVSRGLAVLAAGWAIIGLIWSLLWNEILLLTKSRHTVVVGAGWRGRRLLEHVMEGSGWKIAFWRRNPWCFPVVVDLKFPDALTHWCRINWLATVVCDAQDHESLETARIKRARKLYIFCGNDDADIRVCVAASHLCRKAKVDAHVELRSQQLFKVLEQTVSKNSNMQVHLLNMENITVRELFEAYPLDRFELSPEAMIVHVVVVGWTPMAKEIIRQAILTGIFEHGDGCRSRRLILTWYIPEKLDAEDDRPAHVQASRQFVALYPCFKILAEDSGSGEVVVIPDPDHPWVSEHAILPELRFLPFPTSVATLLHSQPSLETQLFKQGEKQVTSIYFAIDEGSKSVAAATELSPDLERIRRDRKTDIQVFLHVVSRDARDLTATRNSIDSLASTLPVILFDDFLGDYRPANLEGTDLDRLAIQINWMYHQSFDDKHQSIGQSAEGWRLSTLEVASNAAHIQLGDMHSDVARDANALWAKASEADKASSRMAAAHAPVKMRVLKRLDRCGDDIAEHRWLEIMSRIEHRRWCAEQFLQGVNPLLDYDQWKGGCFSQGQQQQICSWFGLETKNDAAEPPLSKKEWKKLYRHPDLIPFRAIIDSDGLLAQALREEAEFGGTPKFANVQDVLIQEARKDFSQIYAVFADAFRERMAEMRAAFESNLDSAVQLQRVNRGGRSLILIRFSQVVTEKRDCDCVRRIFLHSRPVPISELKGKGEANKGKTARVERADSWLNAFLREIMDGEPAESADEWFEIEWPGSEPRLHMVVEFHDGGFSIDKVIEVRD